MSDDPTQRYVLVVVGPVEAATIEANMEKIGGTARDVLRRQPDLPKPSRGILAAAEADRGGDALKSDDEAPGRGPTAADDDVPARRKRPSEGEGDPTAAPTSPVSPYSAITDPSALSPRPLLRHQAALERKRKRARLTGITEDGDEVVADDDKVVYRVYEPDSDELEALYTKINYLKLLEAEAQRKDRENRRRREMEAEEERIREEKKKAKAAQKAILGDEYVPGSSSEEENDEEDEDPEEAILNRPKVRERYKLALERSATLQLLPNVSGEELDMDDWDGPFALDVEIIVKGKDWVPEESEESTVADTTDEGMSSVDEVET
eukprot:g14690.t1